MKKQQKKKSRQQPPRWHHLTALCLGAFVVFMLVQQASAGPITNPLGAPYSKMSVYQGVISVVPGGVADSVMEIGNAGRDIKSTGQLYLFPGNGVTSISPPGAGVEGGQLDLIGANTYVTWNIDSWQNYFRIFNNVPSSNPRLTIDSTGNVGIPGNTTFGGTLISNNQTSNSKSIGVSQNANIEQGSGSFAFLMPYTAINGAYNPVTSASDSGLFFSEGTGFTMGGWNLSSIKGIRLSGGNVNNASLAVNNGASGKGGAGDAVAAYANTTDSAVYAQQDNVDGWAGYFSGRVKITGSLTLGGVDKPTLGTQVCPSADNASGVNSGCLGQYLYSGPDASAIPTTATLRYYYWKESTSTIESVLAFKQYTSLITTCSSGYTKTNRCTSGAGGCTSFYTDLSCTKDDGEFMLNSVTAPYGTGEVCISNTSISVLVAARRDINNGGACTAVGYNPKGYYITGRRTKAVTTGTYYLPNYELR